MPKADLSLLGKKRGPLLTEYTWKDAALYALAVGAGTDELNLIYERHPDGMKVLPGFVVVPAYFAWPDLGDIQWHLVIHGEQIIELHRPLPPQAKVVQTGQVLNIWDKGKGALFEIAVDGELEDGSPLYHAQWNVFYLGAGGFGGPKGPTASLLEPPGDRPPDCQATYQVPQNQAALYRLLGDVNPLHIDPAAARAAGFERPILHGLCTHGYASRLVVNQALGGDPDRIKSFNVRFVNPVYPGDRLTVKAWKGEGGRYLLQAETPNGMVLKNGLVETL